MLSLHYCLIQFLFWFIYGDVIAFANNYLTFCGINTSQIGVLTAVGCILTLIVQPVVSGYADKENSMSLKGIITIPMSLLAVNSLVLVLTPNRSVPVTFALYSISVLMAQMLIPFVNSLGTESARQGIPVNFSVARAMGSVGYAAMSYSMGYIFGKWDMGIHPWTIIAAAASFVIALQLFPFKKVKRTQGKEKGTKVKEEGSANPFKFFARYPRFGLALIGWVLIYICHVFMNNFTLQIVVSKGGGSAEQGTAMAIASIMELPIMFLFTKLLKKTKSVTFFKVAGFFFALKCLGTFLAWNMASFYAVQLLQILGWGLIAVASVYYVDSIMGESDRIKGQSYMTMSYTVGTILGAVIGGRLIDQCGVSVMLVVGTVAATVGSVIVLFAAENDK